MFRSLLALLAPCCVRDLEILSAEQEAVSGLSVLFRLEGAVSRCLKAFSQGILSCGSSFNDRLSSYVEHVVVCFWKTLRSGGSKSARSP